MMPKPFLGIVLVPDQGGHAFTNMLQSGTCLKLIGNSSRKPEVWRRTASHNIFPPMWKVLRKRKESVTHLKARIYLKWLNTFMKKKLPAVIPSDVVNTSNFPLSFTPSEAFCTECSEVTPLSDPVIITSKARIVTMTSVIEDSPGCGQCS